MKPNNTGENLWLWAQNENQRSIQNGQSQDADARQSLPVLYINGTFRGFTSTIVHFIVDGWGEWWLQASGHSRFE